MHCRTASALWGGGHAASDLRVSSSFHFCSHGACLDHMFLSFIAATAVLKREAGNGVWQLSWEG